MPDDAFRSDADAGDDRPLLFVVGAGGFGRETAALAEAVCAHAPEAAPWRLAGFVDDAPALRGAEVLGYRVLSNVDHLAARAGGRYVLAIGHGGIRRRLAERLAEAHVTPATLVHPDVPLHRTVTLGAGCIVCRGVTLTVNVRLGDHVIVNLHATLGHEAVLDDFATLHPGVHISGAVRVGTGATLGTGAVVLPGVAVGAEAVVGAGAVVTRDVKAGATVVGVPARRIEDRG
jgi:sugar O-acyltransferase (sialic acid O-acetyltransferase NeuD family)